MKNLKITKFMSLVFLMCMVSFSLFATNDSYATNINKENNKEHEAIKNVIESYFDIRYTIMSKLSMDNQMDKYFSKSEKAVGFLKDEKNKIVLDIDHRKLQKSDLKFSNYKYYLDYSDIKIDGNTAIVNLYEGHDIYFNSSPEIESQMRGLKHTIQLEKGDGLWLLVNDEYYDDTKQAIDYYLKNSFSIDKARESF